MKKIFIMVLLMIPTLVLAQNTKKVALLETQNGDKTVEVKGIELNMVRGELRKAITNQTGYQAFTRTDIDQLMKEQNFQNSGMVTDSQRKRVGEMSGADYICVSTLTKSNYEFYIEAYLIDIESGEIYNPASQYGVLEGGTCANLFQVCLDLAQELIGYVDGSGYNTPGVPGGKTNDPNKPLSCEDLKRAGFKFLKDRVSKSIHVRTEDGRVCEIKNAIYYKDDYSDINDVKKGYGGVVLSQSVLNGMVLLEGLKDYYIAYICEGRMAFPVVSVDKKDIFVGIEEGMSSLGYYSIRWKSKSYNSNFCICRFIKDIYGIDFTDVDVIRLIQQEHEYFDLYPLEMSLIRFVENGKKITCEVDGEEKYFFEE